MNDSALKAALQKLLAHGDAVEDTKLTRMAAAKKAPKPDACPECSKPLLDGKCEACGYEKPMDQDASEDGMADLLEMGAEG